MFQTWSADPAVSLQAIETELLECKRQSKPRLVNINGFDVLLTNTYSLQQVPQQSAYSITAWLACFDEADALMRPAPSPCKPLLKHWLGTPTKDTDPKCASSPNSQQIACVSGSTLACADLHKAMSHPWLAHQHQRLPGPSG